MRPTAFLLLLAALTLGGCTRTKSLPREAAPVSAEPLATVLGGGDVVDVRFPYAPELNDRQRVRADGMISLQLVGEVQAAGREPAELSAALERLYAAHLKQPAVTVILRENLDRRVFVGGQVLIPGAVDMPGQLTAFDALALAGGINLATGAVGHVFVMRTAPDPETGRLARVGYQVDMRPTLRGEAAEPFPLLPGDHVYVPRTAIVNVNQFMRQYVTGVVPRPGLQASGPLGEGTIGIDTAAGTFIE